MKKGTIRLTVVIPATPAEVFRALTDSRQIRKWSGQKGTVAAKVGGKCALFDGWVRGKVLEFQPARSLAHTWLPGDWPEGADESIVRYTLTPFAGGTKLKLEHSNLPHDEKKNHASGWKEFVFDPLKNYFTS